MKRLSSVLALFLLLNGCALAKFAGETVKTAGSVVKTTGKAAIATGKVVVKTGKAVGNLAAAPLTKGENLYQNHHTADTLEDVLIYAK